MASESQIAPVSPLLMQVQITQIMWPTGHHGRQKGRLIGFLGHNFMIDVGSTTNTYEAQSRSMINICTIYGFDSLIISGSYGGHRQHTTDNTRGMA